ncbi:MAG: serine O-acetyltransferase EpsC [Halobacteriota archaeon]
MPYTYSGDAHKRLFQSYLADEDPFPTSPSMEFPQRTHRCAEVAALQRLLFPHCWNAEALLEDESTLRVGLEELAELFITGIRPYVETAPNGTPADPSTIAESVLDSIPSLRETLKKDVEAAYKGDPAARTYLEIIRSYPGFHAILIQRVANALYEGGAVGYARELTEYAKTVTGIDIHPGATIGEYFFIDHGTGVVIGETATVGDWVRIYQDVTLGALHFEEREDDSHMLKKGYKRHPDIGDHVVIGAGAKVLGPIHVGDHVSIGANSWITEDIPPHTNVYIAEHPTLERKQTE